jgi:Ankyrin repeats (3 copies)
MRYSLATLNDDILMTILQYLKPKNIINMWKADPMVMGSVLRSLGGSLQKDHRKLYLKIYRDRFKLEDTKDIFRHSLKRSHTKILKIIKDLEKSTFEKCSAKVHDEAGVATLLNIGLKRETVCALLVRAMERDWGLPTIQTLIHRVIPLPSEVSTSSLQSAIDKNRPDVFRELLTVSSDDIIPTMLVASSRAGRVELVRILIERADGPPFWAKSPHSLDKALEASCIFGEVEIVNILLDIGADIHYKDDTPLKVAATWGNSQVVHTLLSRGANIHATENYAQWIASSHGTCPVDYERTKGERIVWKTIEAFTVRW